MIAERLKFLDPAFHEKETKLKANYLFFKSLVTNFHKHSKYMESVNKSTRSTVINSSNIDKIIFGTFMKQSDKWRNVSEY